MEPPPLESEPFETRAETAIQKSYELIRQCSALRQQTNDLLSRCKQRITPTFAEGPDGGPDFPQAKRYLMLNRVLDAALRVANTNRGNLQLFDPSLGALRIAAQRGFRTAFLDYFDRVHKGEAACGAAFKAHETVIVEDVTESPLFEGKRSLEVLLDAGVRAVQSTPLIGHAGIPLGIISTHWSSPHRPSDEELSQLSQLGRTLAAWLECNGDA